MKQYTTTIYSVEEALPAEAPLEYMKDYKGKLIEELAGHTVLCLVEYRGSISHEKEGLKEEIVFWNWKEGYFGEEDIWYDRETDAPFPFVSHWMRGPEVEDL